MSINRLKLNKDKTELPLFSKYNPQQSLPPLRFGTDIIKPSSHARNIGAILDTTMLMLPHVNNICKSAFYHLPTISRIRKYFINANYRNSYSRLCSSNLDHCNSLLYNVPKNVIKKLQSVQNWMLLLDWLHAPRSVITSLPSSSIFTGYLFLIELNSRFYYLPSKLCISNLQPIFKT